MILGDDLLILDKKVALKYLEVMRVLDVGINLHKSLVSDIGYGEFAKRLLSPQGEVQGVSLKEFSSLDNVASVVALSNKLNVSLGSFLKFFGFGSKSVGHSSMAFSRLSVKSMLQHLYFSPLIKGGMNWSV